VYHVIIINKKIIKIPINTATICYRVERALEALCNAYINVLLTYLLRENYNFYCRERCEL